MDPTRRKSLRFEFEFVRHFLVFDIGVSPNSSHYSQILSTKPGMPCKEWKLNGSTTRFEHFNAYAESDVGLCKVVTEQHDDSNVNGWHLLQQRAVHHEHFRPRQINSSRQLSFIALGIDSFNFFWGFDVRFKGVQNHRSIPTQLSVTYAQNTIMTYINVQDMRCYWKQWKAMLNIVSRYIPWSENAEMHMGSQLE